MSKDEIRVISAIVLAVVIFALGILWNHSQVAVAKSCVEKGGKWIQVNEQLYTCAEAK